MKVTKDALEKYFSLQEEDVKGPWKKGTDNMCRNVAKSPAKKRNMKKKKITFKQAMEDLLLSTQDKAYTILSDLEEHGRTYTIITADGDCLYRAVLSYIEHPDEYDVETFRNQIVTFALHNMHWFKEKLVTDGENIESYLRNVSAGLTYGDRNVLQIIAMMWKVCISVLNPYEEADHIWHNQSLKGADIILCWNRHNHYSGSEFIEEPHIHLKPLQKLFLSKQKIN